MPHYKIVYKSNHQFAFGVVHFFYINENANIRHFDVQSSEWITGKNVKLFSAQSTVKKKRRASSN